MLSTAQDLILILAAGLVAAVVCRRLNVSVLLGYLVIGTILGDGALGWVRDDSHQIAHVAEVGVFLLLCSIGVEFSIDDVRRLGWQFVVAGSVQMGLTMAAVATALVAGGIPWRAAGLIAAAVSFSSTVLVFRILHEYGRAQTASGRRVIGILLFQDVALVPLLLLVPLLTSPGGDSPAPPLVGGGNLIRLAILSTAFVIAVAGLRRAMATHVLPFFTRDRSLELVVLLTLVVISGCTWVAYRVGLPPAMGAFAAGLIFNGNRWSHQIDALVLPFRETFAAIFFVSLGLIFDPRVLAAQPSLWLVWLPALMGLKTVTAAVALRVSGVSWRSAVGMGLGLAHVGEFAFVVGLIARDAGVISPDDYQRVIALAVMTLLMAPTLLRRGLQWLHAESHESHAGGELGIATEADAPRRAIIVGAGPIGRAVASQLETLGYDVCLVDRSPIHLHSFAQIGFRTVTGDGGDSETLVRAGLPGTGLVVVCVPDDRQAESVVATARRRHPTTRIVVRCRFHASLARLQRAGANEVVAEEEQVTLALTRRIRQAHRG